jgi:hypothetical protein
MAGGCEAQRVCRIDSTPFGTQRGSTRLDAMRAAVCAIPQAAE